ncbi:MAG: hypothetical protein Fur0021_38270 [Candidatus Promineifilaceae bacterium]
MRNYAIDLGAPTPDYDYSYSRLDCYRSLLDGQPGFILGVLPAAASVCSSSAAGNSVNAEPANTARFNISVNPIGNYHDPVTLSITNVPGHIRFGSVNLAPVPG